MTILLLGKDGQVGWQLQRSLAPHGPVVAWGRGDCDLSDIDAVRRQVRELAPRVIVNAAAYTAVDKAENEPALARCVNTDVPAALAEEMAVRDGLLVHYSTDYVFDGSGQEAYREDDATNPLSVYGTTKRDGELAIAATACRSIVFRTSWVFGARGQNFIKTILRLARERESLGVVDDQIGAPTPAALIATVSGVVLAMLHQGRTMAAGEHRLYHLTASRPVSWHAFAQTIVRRALDTPGFDLRLRPEDIAPIPTAEYPTPARRPANSRLDCRRLEGDFGLQMPDWEPYLVRMMQLLSLKQQGY